ncbi:MAG: Cyclic di-GMP phosphodiesterase response regulator RpfG [Pseudomonadota bacterium]
MSTPNPVPPAADTASLLSTKAAGKNVRVEARDVRLGMFIAELDRPWLETPFLFQGFVVGSESELEMIRRHCEHVFVDLTLSEPQVEGMLAALAASQPRSAETRATIGVRQEAARPDPGVARAPLPPSDIDEAAYTARADAPVSRETRDRFRQMLQTSGVVEPADSEESVARRALSRLRAMLRQSQEEGSANPLARGQSPALPLHLLELLPPGTQLQTHADVRQVQAELPQARQAIAVCEATLEAIMRDARSGRPIGLAGIDVAVERLVTSVLANPDGLAWVVRLREESPQGYLQPIKVAMHMVAIGRRIGLPVALLRELAMVGLLADLGKAKLPRTLLEKPGQLEPAEFTVAKGHVQLGMIVLSRGPKLPATVLAGIAQHHERLDGSGYPRGLRNSEIGLHGRIAAIADTFTALSAPRAYANPMSSQDALMGLYQWSGSLYDRFLVEQFVHAIGVFPVGSLVELSTGEVGVVLALDRSERLEPRVLLLTRPDKRPLAEPVELRRLSRDRSQDEATPRIVTGLPSGAFGLRIRDYYAEFA